MALIPAVIYARYSSHNQREESIEGQLRECQDFARRNGMVIVGEYIDRALTGTTDNRASFQRLIRDSEKGNFQAVVMYTLDRFARNRYDSAIYKARLKKNGVKVYYAKQSIPDSPEGIILESVLEGYAEYYSENLSRNIKRGFTDNALQCKSVGGHAPLGLRVGKDQRYEIDHAEAKIVREIFQKYLDGVCISDIVEYCNNQGYRTKTGKKFSRTGMGVILRNERYKGVYRLGDIVNEHGIPAIIPPSDFDRVQEKLHHNYATRARGKAHTEYLLTTKLFCGHCKSSMVGESGTGRNGTTYNYYKCLDRKRNNTCDKKPENKEWIENFVVRQTMTTVLTEENVELIAENAMKLVEKEMADTSALTEYEAQLKDTTKRINNILDMMEQGISTDSTKERLLQLEEQKRILSSNIAREKTKKPFLTKERIMFWLLSFKDGNVDDIEFKRKIIHTLVNRVYVFDTNGGKGRKIIMVYNTSANSTYTINISDIDNLAPPYCTHPNHILMLGYKSFGIVIEIEDIGA